jgi:hypothetical protein
MPRPKKKAPAPGGKGAPIIEEKFFEEKREEKREKYTIREITNEEYVKFGNPDRKSELRQIAEDIVKKVLESNTPLMIKFHDIKVRQIIPVLAQLVADYKHQKITIDFKASVKENALVIKKSQQQGE